MNNERIQESVAYQRPQVNNDPSQSLRSSTFRWVAGTAVWAYVTNDILGVQDECLFVYELLILTCTLILMLCTYWRFHVHRTSPLVRWVSVVPLGTLLSTIPQWYARNLHLEGDLLAYNLLVSSWLWHYRMLPMLLAMIWLGAFIFARLWTSEGDQAR
jgi:hypothetical protein